MPPQYAILRQTRGQPAEFVLYDSEAQTRTVLFTGKRWAARHFADDWILSNPGIPVFNEKVSGNTVQLSAPKTLTKDTP